MIIGKLAELKRYKGLSNNLDKAIDFVLSHDLLSYPVGTLEIEGKDIYLLRQSYVGKPLAEAKPEAHKLYADLQIVLKGEEGFGYAHINNPSLVVTEPYLEAKDVAKFTVNDEIIVPLSENSFALVFPEDVHRPCIQANKNQVEKAVVKIKL